MRSSTFIDNFSKDCRPLTLPLLQPIDTRRRTSLFPIPVFAIKKLKKGDVLKWFELWQWVGKLVGVEKTWELNLYIIFPSERLDAEM